MEIDAHPSAQSAQEVRSMYGVGNVTSMVPVWDAIVDRTVAALRDLANLIGENASGT